MATTKMANRYGLNLKFYEYGAEEGAAELVTVDFANEVTLEITGDMVWATGGQAHSKKIGFKNPLEGNFTISTQLSTMQLLALLSGNDPSTTTTSVTFGDNEMTVTPKFYKIVGETVWVAEKENKVYNETITIYKASPKPNYNVTYSGDGDPNSIDVEFELAVTEDGEMVTIERTEKAS